MNTTTPKNSEVELLGHILEEIRSFRQLLFATNDIPNYDGPLTRNLAAEYLDVHPDTLYKWAVRGDIAYHRIGSGARAPLRFYRKDLDSFISKYRIPTVEEVRHRNTRGV